MSYDVGTPAPNATPARHASRSTYGPSEVMLVMTGGAGSEEGGVSNPELTTAYGDQSLKPMEFRAREDVREPEPEVGRVEVRGLALELVRLDRLAVIGHRRQVEHDKAGFHQHGKRGRRGRGRHRLVRRERRWHAPATPAVVVARTQREVARLARWDGREHVLRVIAPQRLGHVGARAVEESDIQLIALNGLAMRVGWVPRCPERLGRVGWCGRLRRRDVRPWACAERVAGAHAHAEAATRRKERTNARIVRLEVDLIGGADGGGCTGGEVSLDAELDVMREERGAVGQRS
eukprot:2792314-Prymnesium_polylepis.2